MKCNFFLKQDTVLSHTVTSKSYKVEPSLTKRISTFLHERLKYIRGIRKLLGHLGYLHRHPKLQYNYVNIAWFVNKTNGIRNETFSTEISHKLLKKQWIPRDVGTRSCKFTNFRISWVWVWLTLICLGGHNAFQKSPDCLGLTYVL